MNFQFPKLKVGKKYDARYSMQVGRLVVRVYRWGWRMSLCATWLLPRGTNMGGVDCCATHR